MNVSEANTATTRKKDQTTGNPGYDEGLSHALSARPSNTRRERAIAQARTTEGQRKGRQARYRDYKVDAHMRIINTFFAKTQ